MIMQYNNITFNNKTIRTALNEENNEWYFSVVDVVGAITNSKDPRQFLSRLRYRNNELDSFVCTNCTRGALLTSTGIKRTTTIATKEQIITILSYISSSNKEEFISFLEDNYPSIEILENKNSAYLPQKSDIRSLIFTIRNTQVMLDSDIAIIYQVDTKRINEAVKRNPQKFPESFCFALSEVEYETMRSQIATASTTSARTRNKRFLPYAFTERGILMLANVLHSSIANDMSVKIVNEFIEMRNFLSDNNLLFSKVNSLEEQQLSFKLETNNKFDEVFEYIHEHSSSKTKFFKEGSYFDALVTLTDNIQSANKEIILIDNYVNLHTLNILAKKKKDVSLIVITHPKTSITQDDIETFNKEYSNLTLFHTTSLHDRYLIIDKHSYFTIGQSAKDLGRKISGIVEITDSIFKNMLNTEANRIIQE